MRKDHLSPPGKGKIRKILLIPPAINSFYQVDNRDYLPLGLLTLAASLKAKGYNPAIYAPHRKLLKMKDFEDIAHEILSINPAVLGFSTWCITYPSSLLIANIIKKLNPEIPVVFGGPQATLLSKETLTEFHYVDFVLSGECDYTFPELIRIIIDGYEESTLFSIPALTFRTSDGQIIQNKPDKLIEDLNLLPVPFFNLFKPGKQYMLDVGRGCPYQCTFCSTNDFFSKTYRTKSPERIIGEMDLVYRKFGIRYFSFSHDMFTLNKHFIQDFCQKLITHNKLQKRKYLWDCSARCDCVSEDLLKLMKESGCQAVFAGVESGSEKIQKSIRKNLNINDIHKVADICRYLGMEINFSFIIGFPEENEEDIEETLQCITRLSLQGFHTQVSELSLIPGTPLYKQHNGSLKFDGRFSNFSNCICSAEEIKLILKHQNIFSSFYYLPIHPIDRDSLFQLQNLINHLALFRNSLFLLQKFLKEDFKDINLLDFAKNHISILKEQMDEGIPIISITVELLHKYILGKKVSEIHPYISDVFTFEAIKALMLAKYSRWQMIQPDESINQVTREKLEINSTYVPFPYWKTITTSYQLKTILPSSNGWQSKNIKARKGSFHYLIVAVTGRKCNLFRVTNKERILLKKIEYDTVTVSGKDRITNPQEFENDKTLKRMIKYGIININNSFKC